jgi:hypothetical protein
MNDNYNARPCCVCAGSNNYRLALSVREADGPVSTGRKPDAGTPFQQPIHDASSSRVRRSQDNRERVALISR